MMYNEHMTASLPLVQGYCWDDLNKHILYNIGCTFGYLSIYLLKMLL